MFFQSAGNNTFGTRAREVLATFAMIWFAMIVVFGFFKISGLSAVDFSSNPPLLGVCANYFWLHSNSITLGQALASPGVVMGVLGSVLFAPFIEEILFRGFVCDNLASDENGNIKPQGLFAVLAGSFIVFGLVHHHGYLSIMAQGVIGLFLARLWFRNGRSKSASYFSCVAAHSLYNISVVAVAWMAPS